MASTGERVGDLTAPTPEVEPADGHEHDPRDRFHLHEPADFDWVATPDLVPRRHPRVASVEIDGQVVLTHLEAPSVLRLDPVTTVLWHAFDDGVTVRDLAEDVADSLDVDPDVALATMTDTATNLGRAGFLTEPSRPPVLRRPRFFDVPADSCSGKKLGLDRVGAGLVLDLRDRLLRLSATDVEVVDWLAEPFADRLAAPGDPRLDEPVELVAANLRPPAANRRTRLRLLDHYGTLWFGTFDPTEAADALARVAQDRVGAASGGTWLRVPVLVPDDADPGAPVPALVLHPWLSLSIDRLLPGLRRVGVAVHPSPLVRYDATTGTLPVAASPRVPAGHLAGVAERYGASPSTSVARSLPTADDVVLAPVALVGVWDDLGPAEVLERFAPASVRWDQEHLDAVADLVDRTPYARLDARNGLRSSAEQLAALLG